MIKLEFHCVPLLVGRRRQSMQFGYYSENQRCSFSNQLLTANKRCWGKERKITEERHRKSPASTGQADLSEAAKKNILPLFFGTAIGGGNNKASLTVNCQKWARGMGEKS